MKPTPRHKTPKPIAVYARYTLKHPRVVSLIPDHFNALDKMTRQSTHGTGFNRKALYDFMGIPPKRFDAIVKGAMPMLHEAEAYAAYFGIELSEMYKVSAQISKRQAA